jgi:NitT/TauT family transport system ATP-binding protein
LKLAEPQAVEAVPTVPVVAVRDLVKTYASGTEALSSISLDVADRDFLTLLGPSGCGKSTLLRIVAGLAEPTSGSVRWWGAGRERIGEPGRHIAFVFQEPTLMPWARVATNVRLPLDLASRPRSQSEGAVREALALVGLTRFAHSFPRELSGGMQMRVSIARALVTAPDLLLMDEPFGALDEITRARLDSDLLELWQRRRLTVVFVTHSVYEAVFLSTRVVVLSARPGRIVGELAVDEAFPRDDTFRTSVRFAEHCRALSSLLAHASDERA